MNTLLNILKKIKQAIFFCGVIVFIISLIVFNGMILVKILKDKIIVHL